MLDSAGGPASSLDAHLPRGLDGATWWSCEPWPAALKPIWSPAPCRCRSNSSIRAQVRSNSQIVARFFRPLLNSIVGSEDGWSGVSRPTLGTSPWRSTSTVMTFPDATQLWSHTRQTSVSQTSAFCRRTSAPPEPNANEVRLERSGRTTVVWRSSAMGYWGPAICWATEATAGIEPAMKALQTSREIFEPTREFPSDIANSTPGWPNSYAADFCRS